MKPLDYSRIARQALAWVGVWVVVFLVLGGGFATPVRGIFRLLPLLLAIALVVAVNGAVLLPRLYFTGRRGWFVLAGAVLVLALSFFLQYGMAPDRAFPIRFGRGARAAGPGMATLRYLLPLATAFLGSSLFEVMRYAGYQEKQAVQAQREQLATELKFLKSQVNPHFLFNSLNNIYTLTLLRDEQASESLLRLSGMLRYMLYDSETEAVPLGREIEYIRNYISLRRLKDSRNMNIRADLDESRPQLPIAPLLLIPFVENAFKHSRVEDLPDAFVHVSLSTTPGGIRFAVENTVPVVPSPVDSVGGIGLDNVRKRLALLYPDRHALQVIDQGRRFSVSLSLELS
ncbi:sensor histidine kinase [Neolewinella litorea]|uniref:Histidine kinase n=1 Tax=Neolewinella litorea TaxID=2562452 RepID=A0A4S4NI04_9BACT|nr:histidine kinase [Neolewinella litorea]THH39342.1 histidine kinase [Neolewinella litorea]